MPAVSQAQQRFFAICEHNPQHAKGQCPDMTHEKMHEFAATPRSNLPQRASLKKRMTNSNGQA